MGRTRRTVAVLGLAGASATGPLAAGGTPALAGDRAAPAAWELAHVRFEPLDPAGAPLTVEGVGQYRGALELRPGPGGLAVVNDVGLEDYMKGVSEVPPSWPAEAQKAQAIAARTFALHQMGNRAATSFRAAGAHICATDSCQVYTGLEKERRPGAGAWSAAVDATAGQVLLWRAAPILAKYSSSNGGASVPGGRPYLHSVRDPDDAASPHHHWRYAVPLPTLAGIFGLPGELFDVGRAGDTVVLTSRLPDGTQHQQEVPVPDFRARMNDAHPAPPGLPRAVPSLRFTVETNGDGVVIDGRGWGHGIGLSQYGALGKARRGMPAADILAAYYGGLRPVTLAPEQRPASIRVAVALGRGATAVGAPGRFRVLGPDGAAIATVALGHWTVTPTRRGVRVLAPPGYDQPLDLDPLGLVAAPPGPGAPAALRVRLSAPAVVVVSVKAAGTPPVTAPAQVVDPGEQVLALPPASRPGPATATLSADAGPGRSAVVSFAYTVPGAAVSAGGAAARARRAPGVGPTTPAVGGRPGGSLPAAGALLAGAGVAVAGARRLLRRPGAGAGIGLVLAMVRFWPGAGAASASPGLLGGRRRARRARRARRVPGAGAGGRPRGRRSGRLRPGFRWGGLRRRAHRGGSHLARQAGGGGPGGGGRRARVAERLTRARGGRGGDGRWGDLG